MTSAWNHNTLSLQYKLDNEFELVFVVAYQNILKLTYVDKFLTEIQLRFRDKYKQSIESGEFDRDFNDFRPDFDKILRVNFNLLYFYSNNPKLSAIQTLFNSLMLLLNAIYTFSHKNITFNSIISIQVDLHAHIFSRLFQAQK